MKLRNKSGITLIALIVTIIVLIIIAGISIATLMGDNGLLKQVDIAKVTQIEGTAREQMDLACAAVRLAIAEAHAQDNSYSAKENASAIQDVVLNTVKADTTELEEDGWIKGSLDATAGTFIITYEGEDYKKACNDDNAKITYTVTLGQKSIEVTDVSTGLKDTSGNNVVLDVGTNGGTGSDSGSDGESGEGGSSGTFDEELGFYFNTPYTVTGVDEDGLEIMQHIVVKENGIAEIFFSGYDDSGYYSGILTDVLTGVTYDYKTITLDEGTEYEMVWSVSDDGTVMSDEGSLVAYCTFEEYHDIYFGSLYVAQTEELMDIKVYEDGSAVVPGGQTFPAGAITFTLSQHMLTFNGITALVSMDGKRIYDEADGTLLYVLNGEGTDTPSTGDTTSGDLSADNDDGVVITPVDGSSVEAIMAGNPTTGDTVQFGDYIYKYNQAYALGNWTDYNYYGNGWGVRVNDSTKTSYGKMLDNIYGTPVTYAACTFYNCTNLTTAPSISENVASMPMIFYQCSSLTDISQFVIPSGVKQMMNEFSDCTSLSDISGFVIPGTVEQANGVFASCTSISNTSTFTVQSGVKDISSMFEGCTALRNISGFVIPNSVTKVSNLFSGCSSLADISTLSIPEGVTDMSWLLSDCVALDNSDFAGFIIPSTATEWSGLFDDCTGLESYSLSDYNFTTICVESFYDCKNLKTLYIPNTVTTIDERAFHGCSSLTDIHFAGTKAQWNAITFKDDWDGGLPAYTVHCTDGDITQ